MHIFIECKIHLPILMLKPNDRTLTNFKYIFPPLTTQIPAILTHPQKTFVRFWQKLKRQTKATQLLLCSSAEEPQGLPNTKPRTTVYSPRFLPTSPVPPAAGSPSTRCLSDCPSHSTRGFCSLLALPSLPDEHIVPFFLF